MENLIGYQIHKHSHTCKKSGRSENNCRFEYPKPPLRHTLILQPLSKELLPAKIKAASNNFKTIMQKPTEMGRSFKENLPFENFLASLEMDFEEYITALRSSVKRSSVFLQRSTSECYVNAYNKELILAWRANMDTQFVLDPYACAKYCVGYVMKVEGGVSKLLREAARDAKNGNLSVYEKLQQHIKILINRSEISAQEAVAFVLGLQNTFSSRQDVYINTAPKAERIGILKSQEELNQLEDDSDDICLKGLLDHYVKRPPQLETACLA